MSYQPVNGPHLLAAELTLLGAFWAFALLIMPAVLPSFSSTRARWLNWLLLDNQRSVLFVTLAALMARALVLPIAGIPEPRINDEYSYLLMADTFAHGRLANPTPPAWQHFETFHVNMLPTYHSMYPVAQGLVLALGQILFHQAWIGVYLTTALLCGAICWALQALVPPVWALIGGLMAVARLAVFSYWMNSYWGGSLAALGGALALGAVVRLSARNHHRRRGTALACIFAFALLVLATSRPYEGFAFSLPLLGYFGYKMMQGATSGVQLRTILLPVIVIGALGLVMMGFYNHQTTGNVLEMPYVLNHHTYWPLPFFLWEKGNSHLVMVDPVFDQFMKTTAQNYKLAETNSVSGLAGIEIGRLSQNWMFYVGPVLTLPVLVGLLSSVFFKPRLRTAIWLAVFTASACALCLYNLLHYAAPATVVVYLLAAEGLRYLWEQRERGHQAFVIAVCATVVVASLAKQTGSSAINTVFAFPNVRTLIAQQLVNKPGGHLVLVSYDLQSHYPGNELVHNGASFASERILWGRSKGKEIDVDLCKSYPGRTFWSATTDDTNVILSTLDLCK